MALVHYLYINITGQRIIAALIEDKYQKNTRVIFIFNNVNRLNLFTYFYLFYIVHDSFFLQIFLFMISSNDFNRENCNSLPKILPLNGDVAHEMYKEAINLYHRIYSHYKRVGFEKC